MSLPTRRQTLRLGAALLGVAGITACAGGAWSGGAGAPSAGPTGQGDPTPAGTPARGTGTVGPAPSATPRPPGPAVQSAARSLPGRLLFVSDANVWVLERGQSRRLTPDRISRQPSWSRDGQKIALVKVYTSGSDLWIMDADGTNSQELTDFSYRPEAQQNYAMRPAWLPDSAGLLYVSEQGSQDPQLWLLSLEDRRRRRFLAPLGDGAGGIDAPTFSPDGATLAVTRFQPAQGPASRSQIWLWSMPAGPWRQVTQSPEGAYDPGWSPDGQRLAFAVRNAGRHDLWIARADGSGARQVTTAGVCRAPAWSPDGAWLAYLSAQGGTFDVWAVPVGAEAGPPTGADAPSFGATGPARQITKGGVVDAGSGLAWA